MMFPGWQIGPAALKAVYDMARKGARDEIQTQMRDGGPELDQWRACHLQHVADAGFAAHFPAE